MFRALIELLFTILIVIVARAVLSSVMKGIAKSSLGAFQSRPQESGTPNQRTANSPPEASAGSELHKDPVCGTYVAESTAYRRQIGGQTFYYCSDACREKHALVAR